MSEFVDDGDGLGATGDSPTGVLDSDGRRLVRRWVGVAVGVVAVVVAFVLLNREESRPAPPMTAEARAAGAVRLIYPNRHLPPQPTGFLFEGRDPGQVGLINVTPGPGGLVASFLLGGVGDGEYHQIEVPSGGQVDFGTLRVRVLALYDGEWAKDDAADVVVEALP